MYESAWGSESKRTTSRGRAAVILAEEEETGSVLLQFEDTGQKEPLAAKTPSTQLHGWYDAA